MRPRTREGKMQNKQIPISIILPVYNGVGFLEASVTSVLKQSYADFELLILDDNSTDGSLQYLQSLNDERVQLFINEENKGLFYNLNFLIQHSNAPLIKLWAQDDIMKVDCIKTIIEFHKRNPSVGFSYSGRDIIDEQGKIISLNITDTTPEIINRKLHTRIAFFTGSVAGNIANVTLTKKAVEEAGLFNESMRISADFDMWVRIAEKYPVGFIRDHLIQLRDHKLQLSRQWKSYTTHLQEDVRVYQYLLSYINDAEREEGRSLLRNHKLLFYYTLMIKAFLKGSFRSGFTFFNTLGKLDSIWILTFYFIRNRLLFRSRYAKMHLDNSVFIKGVEVISKRPP
jgi:glycosyltransferase involved in cell wall biosynthesis